MKKGDKVKYTDQFLGRYKLFDISIYNRTFIIGGKSKDGFYILTENGKVWSWERPEDIRILTKLEELL